MKNDLEQLFSEYCRDVCSYLFSLSHDASLAEDLTSEVFLEVVRSIHTFRGNSDVKTWLFSIARHRWYHYLRRKQRTAETELLSDFLPSSERSPEEQSMDAVVVSRIWELLLQEPQLPQNIVKMRLKGYSFYEIGTMYNISEISARVIEFRTKTKIRRILEKEGLDDV